MSVLRAAVRRWRAEDLEWNRAHGMDAHPQAVFLRTWMEPERAAAIVQGMWASEAENGFIILPPFLVAELDRTGYELAPGFVDLARLEALAASVPFMAGPDPGTLGGPRPPARAARLKPSIPPAPVACWARVMSATGRIEVRAEDDFYETPAWCVARLLEKANLPGGRWLAPCAGLGAIQRAVAAVRNDVHWVVNELDEARARQLFAVPSVESVYRGDFLHSAEVARACWNVRVVLENPPFLLAEEVLRRAWQVAPEAYVCLLLRLNFAAGDDRAGIMQSHPPDVFVLPNRPSFRTSVRPMVKDGVTLLRKRDGKPRMRKTSTDATEYAWFLWEPASHPRRLIGNFSVLDTTPLEERRRARPQLLSGGPSVAIGKASPLLPETTPPTCR